MLSFIYRLLTRARKRDEVTLDMIGTFEEARVDARMRGRWNYFVFAVREIVGLLGSPGRMIPKTWGMWVAGGGLAGLAFGVAAFYLLPASYTSEAVLMLRPPSIPSNLQVVTDALYLDGLSASVRSRSVLTTIVQNHGLYPNARVSKSLEEIVEAMNKAIYIESLGDSTIRMTLTYRDYPRGARDDLQAAKATGDLVARLIDTNVRRQSEQMYTTLQFFKNRVQETGELWEQLNREMRGLTATDPRFDRLTLDRELARKEYESSRQKLSEAQVSQDLTTNKMGWLLELRDPPSIPQGPDRSLTEIALYGLGGGLLLGFIAWIWAAVRRVPAVLLTPEAAPGD
jgi:hypothetical protein